LGSEDNQILSEFSKIFTPFIKILTLPQNHFQYYFLNRNILTLKTDQIMYVLKTGDDNEMFYERLSISISIGFFMRMRYKRKEINLV